MNDKAYTGYLLVKRADWGNRLDMFQAGLGATGAAGDLIPGAGNVWGIGADLTNAAISAARGNWGEAGLDLLGAIPYVGLAANATNAARRGKRLADISVKNLNKTAPTSGLAKGYENLAANNKVVGAIDNAKNWERGTDITGFWNKDNLKRQALTMVPQTLAYGAVAGLSDKGTAFTRLLDRYANQGQRYPNQYAEGGESGYNPLQHQYEAYQANRARSQPIVGRGGAYGPNNPTQTDELNIGSKARSAREAEGAQMIAKNREAMRLRDLQNETYHAYNYQPTDPNQFNAAMQNFAPPTTPTTKASSHNKFNPLWRL
jgi:hypothetical protein